MSHPYGYAKLTTSATTWLWRWIALVLVLAFAIFWLTLPPVQAPLPKPIKAAITWNLPPPPADPIPEQPSAPLTLQPGRIRPAAVAPPANLAPPAPRPSPDSLAQNRPVPRSPAGEGGSSPSAPLATPGPSANVTTAPQIPAPQSPPASTPPPPQVASLPPQTSTPAARPTPTTPTSPQATPTPPPARGRGPVIALMIGDLGLSDTATGDAIRLLPREVSLAFLPEKAAATEWLSRANGDGHETLLQFPQTIPFWSAGDDEAALLTWSSILQNEPTVTGVTNFAYGRPMFVPAPALEALLEPVLLNNLYYLDSSTPASGIVAGEPQPTPGSIIFIDRQASRPAIEAQLQQLERTARERGYAIGVGLPYPVTLERLPAWIREAQSRGIQIVSMAELRKRLGWP